MGRVLHPTETVESNPAYTMSYQYNLAGPLTNETHPSNKTYATAYDIAGRIAGVTAPSNKVYGERRTTFSSLPSDLHLEWPPRILGLLSQSRVQINYIALRVFEQLSSRQKQIEYGSGRGDTYRSVLAVCSH